MGSPGGWGSKESAFNAKDPGSIPWSGRSPRGGNGNPLQYSCLKNPMIEEPGGLQSMESQRLRHKWAHGIVLWGKHHQWLVGWFSKQQVIQCSYHFLLVKYSLILSFEIFAILSNLIIADWFPDFLCFMLTKMYHNQSVLLQFKMQMKIHNTSPKYNAFTLLSTFKQ